MLKDLHCETFGQSERQHNRRETDSYEPYGFFLNPVINHCHVLYVYMPMFIYLN